MGLPSPLRVLRRYTTFGGETDFFTSVLLPGFGIVTGIVITIVSLFPTEITFHAPNVLGLSAVGIVVGLGLLAYLTRSAGKYTDEAVFHSYLGVVASIGVYLVLSAVAVAVSYGIAEAVTTQMLLAPLEWPAILDGALQPYIVMFGGAVTVIASIVLVARNRWTLAQTYQSVAELEEAFTSESTKSLTRIENTITELGHIERSETARLLDAVENAEHAMVLGDGGVGKSGILKTVADSLDTPVLFIDATRHPGIQNKAELFEKIGIKGDIDHALTQVSLEQRLAVIIDQLDDVGGTEVQALSDLIFDAVDLDNVAVVFACREHDLQTHPEYEPLRNPEEFTARLDVKRLKRTEARACIEELTGTSPSEDLIEVGRNLQYLDVIGELAADGADLTDISGKAALWDKYRESLEDEYQPGNDDRRGGRVLQRAIDYATAATEDNSNIFSVPTDQDWADNQLLNKGVIVASSEARQNRRHRFRHPDFQTYLYAWEAVQARESLSTVTDRLDDRLGKDVFRWMLLLYIQSDVGLEDPFPDLSEASETADQTGRFLEELLDEKDGLGYYATTAILDEVKTWDAEANLELANVVLNKLDHRDELLRYFLDTDTDPSWAYVLRDRSAFDDPDPLLVGFLGDLAPKHPETVSDLLAAVVVEEEHTRGLLISVIQELPADEAANHTDLVLALLADSGLGRDQVSFRTVQLMNKLIKKGEADVGADLLAALSAPHRPEKGSDPVARADLHTLGNALEDTVDTLMQQAASRTIAVLEENLRDTIHLEADLKDRDIDEVVGYYTSPIASSEFSRPGFYDLRGLLAGTLREALELQLESTTPKECQATIETYLNDTTLFRRLGLHLLTKYGDRCPDVLRRELLDASNYGDVWIKKDFLKLLRDRFDDLSTADQAAVMQTILSVPVKEALRENAKHRSEQYDEYSADEIYERWRDDWLRERLWLIRDSLPAAGEEVLSDLLDKYDELPDDPLSSGGVRMGAVSQESPKPVEELRQLTPDELLQFCLDWEPGDEQGWEETESGGFREVNRRGLAEAVAEIVLDDPRRYSDLIPELHRAESVYAAELLRTIQKAVDDDPQSFQDGFSWSAVFRLCETIASNPGEWETEARLAAARLLRTGVATDTYEYLQEYRELKAVLVTFLNDPNPSPERDRPPEGHAGHNNPFQVALNTVRPIALDGLIIYALKTAQQQGYDGYAEEGATGFDQDLRDLLVGMLDDPALAVRAIYGQRLHQIWWLDHAFVQEQLKTLFPRHQNTESRNRFAAAWDTYVSYNRLHTDLYPTLRPYYFHAIDLMDEDETTELQRASEGLAYHIISAYIFGYEDLDDPDSLLTYLYDRADPEFARQIAWGLWRSGNDNGEIRQEWEKVRRLWATRLDQAEEVEAYAEEMQWFVEWLPLIKDHIGLDQTNTLLERTLPFIAEKRRSWETFEEYLSRYASTHPTTAIMLYHELMEQNTRPYSVRFDEETVAVLKPALDHPEIRGRALDIAEQFAEMGDDSAREFLDKNT